MSELKNEIFDSLLEIPLMDVHTHIDASHLSARGIHDVLLYHMVISDLYSAGCPDGARLSEDPTEEEIAYRIERALPYVKYIQNTSCFWGVRTILKDLYGWDKPITMENWREIHEIIKAKAKEETWGREVMKKAGISRICTELWRGHEGQADDILQYSLEWSFFARCQWNQFDTALIELEHTLCQDEPGAPLPVTMGEDGYVSEHRLETIEDVRKAVERYCDLIPYDKVINTASHLSTDITYRKVSREEMEEAMANRVNAGVKERDIYANYILNYFLTEFEKRDITFVFSFGAEPLPYETGSKLRTETVFEVAQIVEQHPNLKFMVTLSSEHQNQALCTLVRELPNLSLAGYWWHNFFPGSIRKVMHQRLDMVALNNHIGFFSDAYCVDWAYAKAYIVRKQLAEVLSQKIEQGQYDVEGALEIARGILYETPQTLARMVPGI